jgi:hypothetical protein
MNGYRVHWTEKCLVAFAKAKDLGYIGGSLKAAQALILRKSEWKSKTLAHGSTSGHMRTRQGLRVPCDVLKDIFFAVPLKSVLGEIYGSYGLFLLL